MINNDDFIYITGMRLRKLREHKKIPQDKLHDVLSETYTAPVARGSFQNYERLSKPKNGGTTSNGMNAATLRILADFYGVSADYILGLTEKKTPKMEVRGISEYSGLDEKYVESLHRAYIDSSYDTAEKSIDLVNLLIDSICNLSIASDFAAWLRLKTKAKECFMQSLESSDYNEAEKLCSLGEDYQQKADGRYSRLVRGFEAALKLSYDRAEDGIGVSYEASKHLAELKKKASNNW